MQQSLPDYTSGNSLGYNNLQNPPYKCLGEGLAVFKEALGVPQKVVLSNDTIINPWRVLLIDYLEAAIQIPELNNQLESAANAAGRALFLCGINFDSNRSGVPYVVFRKCCSNDYQTFADSMTETTGIIALFLAIPTHSLSIPIWMSAAAAIQLSTFCVPTCCSPELLCKYINKYIVEYNTSHTSNYSSTYIHTYPNFEQCANEISSEIKQKNPILIVIKSGFKKCEYANVVAVKDHSDYSGISRSPEAFLLLDNNKNFVYRSYDNLKKLMYNKYKSGSLVSKKLSNYTIIQFVKQ